MNNIKKRLIDNDYFDCRINCNCTDGLQLINAHMVVISISSYFDNLFKWTEANIIKEDKRYINEYNITVDFNKKSLLYCIHLLYDQKEHNMDPLNCDLMNALIFFDFNIEYIKTVMNSLMESLIKIKDYDQIKEIIYNICDSSLGIESKQNFLTRTLCLLKKDDYKDICDKYSNCIPKYVFNNNTKLDNNILIMFGDFDNNCEFEYNNLKFKTSNTWRFEDGEDQNGFWITAEPMIDDHICEKAEVTLLISDGVKTKHRTIRKHFRSKESLEFPPEKKHRVLYEEIGRYIGRYGDIIYDSFNDAIVFEFTITFVN